MEVIDMSPYICTTRSSVDGSNFSSLAVREHNTMYSSLESLRSVHRTAESLWRDQATTTTTTLIYSLSKDEPRGRDQAERKRVVSLYDENAS